MSIISVMILIIVTLSVLQVLICVRNMKKQLSEEYEDNFAMLTKSNAQLISGKIAEYTKQLQVYTTQDILQTGTDEDIVAWLQSHAEIRSSDFDYVAYVDAAGNFDADNMSHTTVSDRSYFKDIFQKGMDATIDDPVSSKDYRQNRHPCLQSRKVRRQNHRILQRNRQHKHHQRPCQQYPHRRHGRRGAALQHNGRGRILRRP